MRTLIVTADPALLDPLRLVLHLRDPDGEVEQAQTTADAWRLLLVETYDLLLLDLERTIAENLDWLRRLRQQTRLPIVVLSKYADEMTKVRALDAGADDYVVRPFGHLELMARVGAVLRRCQVETEQTSDDGYLRVDFSGRVVAILGREVGLTPTEFNLLAHLVRHAGEVQTHRTVLQAVWGPAYVRETGYLKEYIRRLRDKLEREPDRPQYLLTQRGVGYKFHWPTGHAPAPSSRGVRQLRTRRPHLGRHPHLCEQRPGPLTELAYGQEANDSSQESGDRRQG